jgi:hypothetical protein
MIGAAMMAHINEHVAFEYRKQIEEQLGIPLPEMDKELPKDMEVEVSRMMAMAGQKLLQKSQADAQQAQAQQTAQDPLVQMQQQELQLKAQEVQIKAQKIALDAAAQADKVEVEMARIEAQKEIAGMQVGLKAASDKQNIEGRLEAEGVKLGMQMAKDQREAMKPNKPTKKGE